MEKENTSSSSQFSMCCHFFPPLCFVTAATTTTAATGKLILTGFYEFPLIVNLTQTNNLLHLRHLPVLNLRVCLTKDEHGAVGKDLPGPINLLLLQIFLLLTELEIVAVDVVHWCGKIITCTCI